MIFDALPAIQGKRILDLGCGVGDVAAALSRRGGTVVGVDINEDFLAAAREHDGIDFIRADLRQLPELGREFDGIWSSFAAAYFPSDFPDVLSRWTTHLKPGGWIAVTEIDNLFGQKPLTDRTRNLFDAYRRDAMENGRYDFDMGSKLSGHVRALGMTLTGELTVPDREFAFSGVADAEVIEAWQTRLDGMTLLKSFCGDVFPALLEDFVNCLNRPDHASTARVIACIAIL
jgi:SAM-dependent methyltransferase